MNARLKAADRAERRYPAKVRARRKSDFERAVDANEAAGMGEGAAWARAEELYGLEPGDGIDFLDRDEP